MELLPQPPLGGKDGLNVTRKYRGSCRTVRRSIHNPLGHVKVRDPTSGPMLSFHPGPTDQGYDSGVYFTFEGICYAITRGSLERVTLLFFLCGLTLFWVP